MLARRSPVHCGSARADVHSKPLRKLLHLHYTLVPRISRIFLPRAFQEHKHGENALAPGLAQPQHFSSNLKESAGANGAQFVATGVDSMTSSPDVSPAHGASSKGRHRRSEYPEADDLIDSCSLSRQGEPIWPRGNLTAVVLGGGETDSRRLFPLTQFRTMTAIPFGGAYRIIDLLMSNLLNSGVNKIHILTAYNSYSLNRHLQRTYDMSGGVPYGGDGYIEVVANSMSPDSQQWVSGTAGIVRHFMSYFNSNMKNRFIEDVLILPGDHVYCADLTPVISYHHSTGADLTIVCRPVCGEQAKRLGVVKLGPDNRICTFHEKPNSEQLNDLVMSDDEMRPFLTATAAWQLQRSGRSRHRSYQGNGRGFDGTSSDDGSQSSSPPLSAEGSSSDEGDGLWAARALWAAQGEVRALAEEVGPGSPAHGFVGSTGIYIFRRQVLSDALLRHFKSQDFGKQIIPELIREGLKVYAYGLPGYWADVGGSVGDFYEANMALLKDPPSINFNTPVETPFFRYPLTLPASQLQGTRINKVMMSAGCLIKDAVIRNSVVGPRAIIGSRVQVTDSVIMGADHYEHEKPQIRPQSAIYPPMGIGEDSIVQRAIVDMNCRIGRGVKLVNKEGVYESFDRAAQGMYVRDGVIVLTRDSVLPNGTVL